MPPEDPLLVRKLRRRVPRAELRGFLSEVTKRVARGRGVVCLITDDSELRRLNRQFRGKNRATDVLSFPSDPANGASHGALGEIAISIDRATEQAVERGHSLTDELRILMLHGLLHLSGFDHETDSGEMARAEMRWRKRLGLPAGLIERSSVGRLITKTPIAKTPASKTPIIKAPGIEARVIAAPVRGLRSERPRG
jgi:probable rRNA maturation factor